MMKTCTKCRESKPIEQFGKDSKAKDGKFYWCKECARAHDRAYYYADPSRRVAISQAYYWRNVEKCRARARSDHWENREANIERMRKYREENPHKHKELSARRHARKVGAPVVEKIDREYVWERDGGRCHICGKKIDRSIPRNFHLDHLVPLSKGGNHTHDNLRAAHQTCNAMRHAGRLPAQLLLVG